MKRLKALIKMELKPALFIGAYFLLVNLWALFVVQNRMQNIYNSVLVDGIQDFIAYNSGLNMSNTFMQNILEVMLFTLIGILVLTYASFKNDKSIEIGRFLKSLPYTTRERCLTKIGIGVGTFTLTYLVYVGGMIFLNNSYLNQFREFYEVTVLSETYTQIFNNVELMKALGLVYVGCIAIYLFSVMFQYLVSHRVGSVIVAVLVYAAPVFIFNSISDLSNTLSPLNQLNEVVLEPFADWINELMIVFEYIGWGVIGTSMNISNDYTFSYSYMGLTGYRLAFYVILSFVALGIILKVSQSDAIEKSDYLIPSRIFRTIFTCGVTVCSTLLVGDVYCMYSNQMNGVTMLSFMFIAAVVSFFIAKRIARIGMRKEARV